MASCVLPRDVLLIVRDFIPSGASDLATHVNLCDAADLMRDQLYDSPAIWQRLTTAAGFSLSRRQLPTGEARPTSATEATPAEWKALAADVAAAPCEEDGRADAVQVVGVEAGSEGVEAQLFWGSVVGCARKWLDHRSFASPPLSPEHVRKRAVRLEMNPYVAPFADSAAGLWRLPTPLAKERRVVERGEPPADAGWDGNLLSRYPVIAHSFATCPPVTELLLWLGPTRVHNPNGVTVWDVRQAILKAPRASALVCFLDPMPYKPGPSSSSTASASGPMMTGNAPPEWLLAHDRLLERKTITPQAWAQDEPGSVKLGEPRGLQHYAGGNFGAFGF